MYHVNINKLTQAFPALHKPYHDLVDHARNNGHSNLAGILDSKDELLKAKYRNFLNKVRNLTGMHLLPLTDTDGMERWSCINLFIVNPIINKNAQRCLYTQAEITPQTERTAVRR